MRRLACCTVAAFVTVSIPRLSRADETPESLISQGVALRRAGKDAQAQGYFQRAYDLAHTPRSAAQLALVELALKDYFHAERHFSEALANSQDAWIRAQKKTLESSRREARKHLGELHIHGLPPGGAIEVSTDDAPAGEPAALDAQDTVWLPEGSVIVKATAPSYKPSSKTFAVKANERSDWQLNLEATPREPAEGRLQVAGNQLTPKDEPPVTPLVTPPVTTDGSSPAASEDSGRALRYTGVAVAAVGVGAVVTGFVLRSMATSKMDRINKASANMQIYDPADGNWQTLDKASIGLFIGGGAAILGGAALFIFNRDTSVEQATTTSASSKLTFAFSGSPRQAFILQGRF